MEIGMGGGIKGRDLSFMGFLAILTSLPGYSVSL